MKLFFSYGHDSNKKVVLQLYRDLERMGHEVWLDQTKIHETSDWRNEIFTGIGESEAVISFFSNHAFRDFGVCLDELMIAVGLRGSLIQGVKLETLTGQNIRDSISYQKVIDMRSWREMEKKGLYDKWYEQKLKEILEFVENPYVQEYSNEIEKIRNWIQPSMKDITQRLLEGKFYSPRRWIRTEVDQSINNGSKIILISGTPGSGKSMFTAHEFMSLESARVILFCKYGDRSNITALSLLSEMVFMLAAKEDDYRKELLELISKDENQDWFKDKSAEELFTELIVRPLNKIAEHSPDHPDICILIDGLDEMVHEVTDGESVNPIARILKEKSSHLPDFVKFILTSRPDIRIMNDLKPISTLIDIDSRQEQNTKDIFEYFLHRRKQSKSKGSKLKNLTVADLKELAERSGGNFLYASIALDAFEKGLFDKGDIANLSSNLTVFYYFIFSRLFPKFEDYRTSQKVLAALSFAESVVPLETVKRIISDDPKVQKFLLERLSILLRQTVDGVSLFHKSIFDWLNSNYAYKFRVSESDGKIALAQSAFKAYEQNIDGMNVFELRYLLPYSKEYLPEQAQMILQNRSFAEKLFFKGNELKLAKQIPAALDLSLSALEIFETLQDRKKAYETGVVVVDLLHHLARTKQTEIYAQKIMKYGALLLEEDLLAEERNKILVEQGKLCLLVGYALYRQNRDQEVDDWYQKAEDYFSQAGALEYLVVSIRRRMEMYNLSRNTEKIKNLFNIASQDSRLKELKEQNLEAYCGYLRLLGIGSRSLDKPELERYQLSLKYLDQEWELCLQHQDKITVAEAGQCAYNRAVSLYKFSDRLDEALAACEKALELIEEAEWSTSVGVCDTLGQIGNTALRIWNEDPSKSLYLQKALVAFERAYKIRKNVYTDYNRYTTISLGNLVKVNTKINTEESLKVARQYMDLVLKVREELFTSSNLFWKALGYQMNGELLIKEGDLLEAESYFEKATQVFDGIGRKGEKGICLMQRGKLQRDPSLKKKYLEEAQPLILESYHPGHGAVLEINQLLEKAIF